MAGGTVINELLHDTAEAYNVNTLGRWTRELSARSGVEVQAYYDRTYRKDPMRLGSTVDTIDLTAEHTFGADARHDVIWGFGYRWISLEQTTFNTAFGAPAGRLHLQLFSAFIQDEFKLIPEKLTTLASPDQKPRRPEHRGADERVGHFCFQARPEVDQPRSRGLPANLPWLIILGATSA